MRFTLYTSKYIYIYWYLRNKKTHKTYACYIMVSPSTALVLITARLCEHPVQLIVRRLGLTLPLLIIEVFAPDPSPSLEVVLFATNANDQTIHPGQSGNIQVTTNKSAAGQEPSNGKAGRGGGGGG